MKGIAYIFKQRLFMEFDLYKSHVQAIIWCATAWITLGIKSVDVSLQIDKKVNS